MSFTISISRDVTDWPEGYRPFDAHQTIEATGPDGEVTARWVVRFARFHSPLKALRYRKEQKSFGHLVQFSLGKARSLVFEIPTPEGVRR